MSSSRRARSTAASGAGAAALAVGEPAARRARTRRASASTKAASSHVPQRPPPVVVPVEGTSSAESSPAPEENRVYHRIVREAVGRGDDTALALITKAKQLLILHGWSSKIKADGPPHVCCHGIACATAVRDTALRLLSTSRLRATH